jgi:hypothetical protein
MKMKLRTLGYIIGALSLALSSQVMANGNYYGNHNGHHNGNHKPQPLNGCYQVVRGYVNETPSGGFDSIGTHQLVLKQEGNGRWHKRKYIEISGPFAGREDLNAPHEEGEEEEEPHGKHWFGTYNRSGAFWGYETAVGRLGEDCFNPVTNRYDIVHFFEVFEFNDEHAGGTGAYSGLIGGDMRVSGTLDRCTDPNNVQISFDEITGELCFE